MPTADPALHTNIQGSHAVATTPTTTYEEQLATELFGCLTENPEYVEREFGEEISSLLEDPDSFRATILRAPPVQRSKPIRIRGSARGLQDLIRSIPHGDPSLYLWPSPSRPDPQHQRRLHRTGARAPLHHHRPPGRDPDWRLVPSAEGLELALVRLEVQNHTAVSAVVNIEGSLVLLRDSTGESYFPFDIAASVRQDPAGQPLRPDTHRRRPMFRPQPRGR